MAGSVTITYGSRTAQVKTISWSWVSDASGDVSGAGDTAPIDGVIYRWATNPGSTAPTANYDITVLDSDGADVAAGLLANRHTSSSETVQQTAPGAAVNSVLSLVVASAGNAKEGTLTAFYQGKPAS